MAMVWTFTANVMLLPMGGCDMVLGIQWLSTLGDIKWNFQNLKIEFLYNNKRVCLRGTHKSVAHWLDIRKQIKKVKAMDGAELMMLSIYPNTGLQLMSMEQAESIKAKLEPKLQEVIDVYVEVFAVPNKLPPVRSQDHKIQLMPSTSPINIRPYRHPLVQLNKHTIKDKFPIPIIKELINELYRVVIFTKLDLSLEDHVHHLAAVLSKMKERSLYAKESKCVFGTTNVEYLGHVISSAGVLTC
ncbi:hypothetical protein Tco_0151096 [Tanacetum coccineum]